MLELQNLTKRYGRKTALSHIDYKFKSGIIGLLGPNGSGKTTLLNCIAGILQYNTGEIKYKGENIHVLQELYRDDIGYLPQHFGYYPEETGYQFLLYFGALKGMSESDSKNRALELLKLLHLDEVKNNKIKTYSGGMKQRLGIAIALLNNPKILILDEPTVGLDPMERNVFLNLLSTLPKETLIFLSTHIVSDIESIANHVIIMKDGTFFDEGSVSTLASRTKGKVFERNVMFNDIKDIPPTSILQLKQNEGFMTVRFLANESHDQAVESTLQDYYLSIFGTDHDTL